MEATAVFDLGTVLSVVTPILLTDIGNVYEILNYMTGDNLYTHQLPRVAKEMQQVILEQYPNLAEVNTDGIGRENWQEFLKKSIEKYGNSFPIIPCGLWQHKSINPQDELVEMLGGDESKMIIVDPSIFDDKAQ